MTIEVRDKISVKPGLENAFKNFLRKGRRIAFVLLLLLLKLSASSQTYLPLYTQINSFEQYTSFISEMLGAKQGNVFVEDEKIIDQWKSIETTTLAICTSTGSGLWSNSSTWSCGAVPGAGDDVIIAAGTTVTIDAAAQCLNITVNGTLTSNAGINLDVNGSWTNNGAFNASTGTVTFKGSASNTISGSSPTAFNNIIVNKGTDATSVLEANGTGAISNTGTLTITNGLFKMTTGTFQFGGVAGPIIPASGGIWVNGANFSSGNYTITNNGWIRVTSGTANFGTGSGNAVHTQNRGYFNVSGGVVNISGRLENTASTPLLPGIPGNGVSISGGTITLSTVGNNLSNVGSFDMSSSSILNMTGGTVVFQNPSTAATPLDLNIISGGTKSITGGTFQIGNASSPANSTFLINSAVALHNLSIFSNSVRGSLTGNDLRINNQLTLNGQLQLNNQNLIIGSSAPAIAGTLGNGNGMVVTNGTGELRKSFFVDGSYLFPVSSGSTGYAPVTLNITAAYAAGAYAGVKTVNAKHPNNGNTNNYLNRYWTVNTSGISGFYNIDATYQPTDIVGSDANIAMGKYTSLPWIKYGSANTGTKTLTATNISTAASSNAFSGITLAPPTVTISGVTTICSGTSTTLTANPVGDVPFTYLWNTTATTSSITVSSAGTYSVTVTDVNGFTASTSVGVTVNPLPSCSISGSNNVCPGSTNPHSGPAVKAILTNGQ